MMQYKIYPRSAKPWMHSQLTKTPDGKHSFQSTKTSPYPKDTKQTKNCGTILRRIFQETWEKWSAKSDLAKSTVYQRRDHQTKKATSNLHTILSMICRTVDIPTKWADKDTCQPWIMRSQKIKMTRSRKTVTSLDAMVNTSSSLRAAKTSRASRTLAAQTWNHYRCREPIPVWIRMKIARPRVHSI